jgi:flagellar basal body P-ring formation protein FlgA
MKRMASRLVGIATVLIGSSAAAEWQTLESIERAAEHHVASAAEATSERVVVEADPLDTRLQLPLCEGELATDTPYGNPRANRTTVEVSCPGPAWRVFVPVSLEAYGRVVVAARPLPRDAVLTRADLSIEERALGQLGRGYIASPETVVGLKLRRAVAAGAPLAPAALASPRLVERGQIVTLQASSGGISVAMTGTALQDGARGAVIDVQNSSSGRRVQAIVRSQRVVEVLLQ